MHWVGKIPWKRAWQPTPVFLFGESPWTEEPGWLHSRGLQREGQDWVTKYSASKSLNNTATSNSGHSHIQLSAPLLWMELRHSMQKILFQNSRWYHHRCNEWSRQRQGEPFPLGKSGEQLTLVCSKNKSVKRDLWRGEKWLKHGLCILSISSIYL